MKKKILLITFYFPPINNAGGNRTKKLVNDLCQNYDVSVLTLQPLKNIMLPLDYNNVKQLNKKINVYRYKYYGIFGKILSVFGIHDLFFPDNMVDWMFFSLPQVIMKLKRLNIDCIYATGPPFTVILYGFILKTLLKSKLIIEYRDPWTNNPYERFTFNHKKSINEFFERHILKSADLLSFVSEPLEDAILLKYEFNEMKNKSVIFPNGIKINETILKSHENKKNPNFQLVLTSTIYGERNPELFFKTISLMDKKGLLKELNFCFHIYGAYDPIWMENLIRKYGIEMYIQLHWHPSHEECLIAQSEALLLVDLNEKNLDYPTFPYHFWEYLASEKKILYLGKDESYKANFIRKYQLGYVLPLDKPKKFINEFENLIIQFKTNKLLLTNKINPDLKNSMIWDNNFRKMLKKINHLMK